MSELFRLVPTYSIRYEVFEKIRWNRTEEDDYYLRKVALIASVQLAVLGSLMLMDDAEIFRLSLVADGEAFHFQGSKLDENFSSIVRAIQEAEQFELVMKYTYTWRDSTEHLAAGPYVLAEYLEYLDARYFDRVDYVLYCDSDSPGSRRGSLCVYGVRNSIIYRGPMELKEMSELPEEIAWSAPRELIIAQGEAYPAESRLEVRDISRALMGMGRSASFDMSEESLTLFLRHLQLETVQEVHGFATMVARLQQIVRSASSEPRAFPYTDTYEFYSDEGDYPRQLSIEVYDEGNYRLLLSAEEEEVYRS